MNAVITFMISMLCLFPTWDKIWAPYDEGFILEASRMAAAGMVPYKDFFILMYPPGQIYTLAALLRIFGNSLFVGRLYTIVFQAIVCMLVFCIVKRIAKLPYAIITFIICLSTVAAIGEPIPRPIWPAMAFSLMAIFFILNFIEKGKTRFLMLSGCLTALTIVFKHELGFLTSLVCSVGLLIYARTVPYTLKLWARYAVFPVVTVLGLCIWLFSLGAAGDAFRSLVIFPREFCKSAAIPFPGFCFDFSMIFHRGCAFIKHNEFYIPLVVSIITALFILPEFISKKRLEKSAISSLILLMLAVAYLQQIAIRADSGHLAMAVPPAAMLFGISLTYLNKGENSFWRRVRIIAVLYMSLLMALFLFKNIETYYKNSFVRPFIKKNVKLTTLKNGSVYVPDDVRSELLSLLDYVGQNTAEGERIYIGNLKSALPQFGYNEIIYFLADRFPAVKYYEMHPGLQDKGYIQNEVILLLKQNNVRVLLLRDSGNESVPGPLDIFIKNTYREDRVIGETHIYVKK